MNFIKSSSGKIYRADEIFYQIGKIIWLPFLAAGFWFAYDGYERYGELAACSIREISGLPCPGCGGTRAFYYLFRGELLRSFQYHAAVLYGVAAYMHFMFLCFCRKHLNGKWDSKEISVPYYMYIAIAVILAQWIVKIFRIILLII